MSFGASGRWWVCCLAVVLGWCSAASAQEQGDESMEPVVPGITKGVRPMGMGSAFTANASSNGALYHNPAGISSTTTFSLEGGYFLRPGLNGFNVSVVDSKLNQRVAMGLAYTYELTTRDNSDLAGHDARVALATRPHPNLVLGLSGRYLDFQDGDDSVLSGFTLDLGAIYRITEGFFIGVAGNNLLDVCDGDTDGSCFATTAPRVLRGGLALGTSLGFQVSADAQADLTSGDEVQMTWSGGAELLIESLFALRGGYQYLQGPQEHVVTAGLGIKSWQVGLDLGYAHNLQTDDYLFSAGIQLYPTP